jgi:hypothetical protein
VHWPNDSQIALNLFFNLAEFDCGLPKLLIKLPFPALKKWNLSSFPFAMMS